MTITVISTAFAAKTETLCRESVADQKAIGVHHVYVDASKQDRAACAAENLWLEARAVDPSHIIALVDGDDWLAGHFALAHVAKLYEDPNVWLTYGSFAYADGRPGFAAPYKQAEDVRRSQFRATHLKTFRAALFHHLDESDFRDEAGQWVEHARDHWTMFPLMELAGLDRCRFVPEILYTYNLRDSFEFNAGPAGLRAEQAAVRACRARTPKTRLVSL